MFGKSSGEGFLLRSLPIVRQPNTLRETLVYVDDPVLLLPVVQAIPRCEGFYMKEIPLTQGKAALVDDADYEWLSQWKWCAHRNRRTGLWYALRHTSRNGNKTIRMHRLIMGTPEGMDTDHVDHDGLHNWRGNLRVCTRSQNHQNRRLAKANTSGYKGVSWRIRIKRWRAAIQCNKKWYWLGNFNSAEDAGRAYNEAAVRMFGEFACLNDISESGSAEPILSLP